jgi:hypothetical protein
MTKRANEEPPAQPVIPAQPAIPAPFTSSRITNYRFIKR